MMESASAVARHMAPVYIGVDPGAGGALALLRHLHTDTVQIQVEDMPTHEINGKRRIDLHALVRQFRQWAMVYANVQALVENVGAMPGQASMFPFGFACGAVQTAIVAADIPLRLVTPQVWKKHYQLQGGQENKDQSRQRASQLFPQHAHLWPLKKHDGRAEAVLLANYGRIQ